MRAGWEPRDCQGPRNKRRSTQNRIWKSSVGKSRSFMFDAVRSSGGRVLRITDAPLSLLTDCYPTYELGQTNLTLGVHTNMSSFVILHSVAESPQKAVRKQSQTRFRRCGTSSARRSMPTVWSERGDGRSALRGSASPGGLAKVAVRPLL